MHDKASEFTVQNEFTVPLYPWQRQMLQLALSDQPFRMTPRPRKYFAVITLPSGARVELPRQETPESALNRAKDHGYSEDQITIKMETPILGQSETVPTETLRERFEKWVNSPKSPLQHISRTELAWEAFQEGAKAVS